MKTTYLICAFIVTSIFLPSCSGTSAPPATLESSSDQTSTSIPIPPPTPSPREIYQPINATTSADLGIVGNISPKHAGAAFISFSPDKTRSAFAIINEDSNISQLLIDNAQTGLTIELDVKYDPASLLWSDDSSMLALFSNGKTSDGNGPDIGIWDLDRNIFSLQNIQNSLEQTTKPLPSAKTTSPKKGGPLHFYPTAWSPDNSKLVIKGVDGLYIWDLENQAIIEQYIDTGIASNEIRWRPDGKYIAKLIDNEIKIFTTDAHQRVFLLVRDVDSLTWSPNNKYLAILKSSGELNFYDEDFLLIYQVLHRNYEPDDIRWSNSGAKIIYYSLAGFEILNLESGERINADGVFRYSTWSPDDSLIVGYSAYSSGLLHWKILDTVSGETIFENISPISPKNPASEFSLTPNIFWLGDGFQLAVNSEIWAIPLPESGIIATRADRSWPLLDFPGVYLITVDGRNSVFHKPIDSQVGTLFTDNGESLEEDLPKFEDYTLLSQDAYLNPLYTLYPDPAHPSRIFFTSYYEHEYFTINLIDLSAGTTQILWAGWGKTGFEIFENHILVRVPVCWYCDYGTQYGSGVVIINLDSGESITLYDVGNVVLNESENNVTYQTLIEIEYSCEENAPHCTGLRYEPSEEIVRESLP